MSDGFMDIIIKQDGMQESRCDNVRCMDGLMGYNHIMMPLIARTMHDDGGRIQVNIVHTEKFKKHHVILG